MNLVLFGLLSAVCALYFGHFGQGIRKTELEPMTHALNSCQTACDNDKDKPHRVYAGNKEETLVICYCQGYGSYEEVP